MAINSDTRNISTPSVSVYIESVIMDEFNECVISKLFLSFFLFFSLMMKGFQGYNGFLGLSRLIQNFQ